MGDFRKGLLFDEDVRTDFSFQNDIKTQIFNIESKLLSGINGAKEIANYIYEKDRTEHIKKRCKIELAAQKKISEIRIEAAEIEYENYVSELQEKLEFEKQKIELEIQRFKLEIEEKMKRESITFEASMKKSQVLKNFLKSEIESLNTIDELIQKHLSKYNQTYDSEDRMKYQRFCDKKLKTIKGIEQISSRLI